MPNKRAPLFAFTGGLLHIALAGGLMLLPVFATCFQQGQEVVCTRQSYIQQGGNVLGLGLFLLLVALDRVWRAGAGAQRIAVVTARLWITTISETSIRKRRVAC